MISRLTSSGWRSGCGVCQESTFRACAHFLDNMRELVLALPIDVYEWREVGNHMRIEDLRSEKRGDRTRVAATVNWEDSDRPTQEVYFETCEPFADALSCNPHAFLVGCIVPAMHYGEERVFIDAAICPELQYGLGVAMSWLRQWYYPVDHKIVRIEAKTMSDIPAPRTPERAGFFFSGGIDSFAVLRANRLRFPLEHPWSIKDGILVYGLELDDTQMFEYVLSSLSDAARDADITLIPVYTNLYLHYRDEDAANQFDFWLYEFGGAALAAVAHALSRRLTVASIAATYDTVGLERWGSHPLLDPNYGSIDLRIRHDLLALSRLERTKLVADWDVALEHLRVCNRYSLYRPGSLNCGQCEKCVRTMLALLTLGVLDQTRAFPEQEVSEELVRRKAKIHDDYVASVYPELIPPLSEMGRHDLVRAIEYRIARYYDCEPGLKASVKRFDRRYLNGNLRRFVLRVRR
jgi:hypothetical protein